MIGSRCNYFSFLCLSYFQKYLSKLDHIKVPDQPENSEGNSPEPEEAHTHQPVDQEEHEKIENVQDFLNDIKSAASQVVLEQNFIYEPTSGLYYDPRTGYYYNAEYGLYYDGNTGCYYKYDENTGQFDFHSQVQAGTAEEKKVGFNPPKFKEKPTQNLPSLLPGSSHKFFYRLITK